MIAHQTSTCTKFGVLWLLFVAACLAPAHPASAQNLVQNPGFLNANGAQSSGLTSPDWMLVDNGDTSFSRGGVSFGTIGGTSTLSQTIATSPLTSYIVSFFLEDDPGAPYSFLAQFDGQTVLSLSNSPPPSPAPGFLRRLFSVTITTDSTSMQSTLLIIARQDPAFFFFDSPSVQAAPAPVVGGGFMSLAAALAGLILRRMRHKASGT